jgi:hypothetical protein
VLNVAKILTELADEMKLFIRLRAPCLTQQGDCVAVIAQQVSEQEVMGA